MAGELAQAPLFWYIGAMERKQNHSGRPHDPSEREVALLRTLAADPAMTYRHASRVLGISVGSLQRLVFRLGLEWRHRGRRVVR